MNIRIHPHAQQRMIERGATRQEVEATIVGGEIFQAKFGRVGFRRNFPVNGIWRGRRYTTKQMEVYAVEEDGWNVITVIVKYFHA